MNKYKADKIYSQLDFNREEENKVSAERQLANAQLAHRQATQDLVNLRAQRMAQTWRDTTDLEIAKARASAVGFMERQTNVIAPVTGLVDGLVIKAGDLVQPGQLMAKLIPKDCLLVVVAFLQEKDRAFVKDGDEVELELNQYTYSEFGTIRGRIHSVAADLASPSELQEAFGSSPTQNTEGPSFRVEIEVLEDPKALEVRKIRLRPGMLLSVRFTLRRQNLITLAIDPLRKWLN
jgi:HlyD family secretion protein